MRNLEFWNHLINNLISTLRVASMHTTFSLAVIRSSEKFVFIILSDKHHLDGLVVIGSVVMTWRACGWYNLSLYKVVGGSSCRSSEEPTHSEHFIYACTKGKGILVGVLQQGLMASANSPQQNIKEFLISFLLYTFIFENIVLSIYYTRIVMVTSRK